MDQTFATKIRRHNLWVLWVQHCPKHHWAEHISNQVYSIAAAQLPSASANQTGKLVGRSLPGDGSTSSSHPDLYLQWMQSPQVHPERLPTNTIMCVGQNTIMCVGPVFHRITPIPLGQGPQESPRRHGPPSPNTPCDQVDKVVGVSARPREGPES